VPRRLRRRLLAAAIAIAAPLAGLAPPAGAGTYDVRQCDYLRAVGTHELHWQGAGTPAIVQHTGGAGCGEFGLTARNSLPGHEHTYPSGGYGGWFAYAPGGTRFTRFAGAFGTLSGCCINGLGTYAEATEGVDELSGRRAFLFQGHLGNGSWLAPSGVSGPVGRSWDAASSGFSARRVGFYLRCGPGFSCFQRTTGDLRLRARSFEFTLRDDVTPSVAAPGGSLTAGGWLSGARTLTFGAGDAGGGIARVEASFDTGKVLSSPSSCATVGGQYVRLVPCPLSRGGSWTVDTRDLPDGVHAISLRAVDAGGAAATRGLSIAVDNTPPAAPRAPALDGGAAWRADRRVTLRWANPPGQHAPIARAHYRACPSDGGACVVGGRDGDDPTAIEQIAVPHAGSWELTAWLEDAAGNVDPAATTTPVVARIDPDPPTLRFRPQDPDRPAEVAVDVADRSGVVGGGVEVREPGARGWRALASRLDGSVLRATLDGLDPQAGAYELRASAVDRAANRATIAGPTRTLPVRRAVVLDATLAGRVRRSRLGCRPAGSRRCRRPARVERERLLLRGGAPYAVRGRLRNERGGALAGRAIAVAVASPGRRERTHAGRTGPDGRFALRLRARRSAALRVSYAGDRGTLPGGVALAVSVPAAVSMRAPRRAVGGRRVWLRGRVHGGGIPRRGKLVEVQAHFRGRWRTISAVRTDRRGRWRFGYVFRSGVGPARYRLRAQVPAESGYPFATGRSRPVRISVRPR
jgi:hypothetical protein